MHFLKKYIPKYWKPFCIAVAFLTLEAFCDLMQPTIMSKIVDIGVANKKLDYVIHMGLMMIGVTGIGAVAAISRNIISSNVSQKFGTELRSDLFKKIYTLSFDSKDKFETSSLVTRLTNDVTQVQNFINGLMRIFVKAPLLCLGSFIMAVRLSPRLSIIMIIIIPVISILIYINMHMGYPYFVKVQKALDKVNDVMREYLAGVRVVKAFNRFGYETDRFEKSNDELSSITTSAMRIMAIFSPMTALIVNFGIASVLWFGGYSVSKGQMHVGQIIAFTNYMTQILFSLNMISFVFTMFVRARASAERINEVFSEENNMKVKEKTISSSNIRGSLEFKNVSFAYANSSGEKVLENISFTCSSGETIGIIGSTGSGKSTMVNLIPRFYDVTEGSILVDGIDVKNYDPKTLREKIALVPQKTVLFTGTVADNIRWGKEDATLDEIKNSAVISQADEFISTFPEGYDTMLGQGGVNFSGGQKQRVSIARALIREPEILILDDCTSAVDMTTEAKIKQSLNDYSKSITCIVIAQRITSVINSDKIIVLNNGKIADIGTHNELMNSCEIYQDIFHSQLGREVI